MQLRQKNKEAQLLAFYTKYRQNPQSINARGLKVVFDISFTYRLLN